MNWNELPQEYRDLEKTFNKEKCNFKDDVNEIIDKFDWESTPQEIDFWDECYNARTIDELPEIENVKKSVEKEQTFEVVSFKSKITKKKAYISPNGFYQKNAFDNSGWTYETLINDKDTEIYDVRRNSDNKIFTLGEETNNGVIKEFQVSEDRDDMMVLVDNNWLPINFVNEQIQILFEEEPKMSEEQIDGYIGMNLKERMELTHKMSKRIYEEFKNKKNIAPMKEIENPKSNFNVQFDKTFFENIVDSYQAKNEGITDCSGNEVKEFPFLPTEDEKKLTKYLNELKKKYSSNNSFEGIKESEGKINVEYDWAFLKGQMNRMSKNKDKYPKNNWKKPMDVEQLKDAMFRHTLEVMDNNFEDDGDAMGHLYAISLNAMMIFTQLNDKNK